VSVQLLLLKGHRKRGDLVDVIEAKGCPGALTRNAIADADEHALTMTLRLVA
jgi:hypothetical protein